MYRVTVIVEGGKTGNLSAGLAEVQKKVEYGFTSGHDGEPDGNYRFKVGVIDPNKEAQLAERSYAVRLADISCDLDKAVANDDLGAIANSVDELKRLRLTLDARDGSTTQHHSC